MRSYLRASRSRASATDHRGTPPVRRSTHILAPELSNRAQQVVLISQRKGSGGRCRHGLMWCIWTSRFSATGAGRLSPDLQPVAADPALTLCSGDAARISGNGLRIRTAVFASGMEARRVKTREAGLQRSRQPGPAGRRQNHNGKTTPCRPRSPCIPTHASARSSWAHRPSPSNQPPPADYIGPGAPACASFRRSTGFATC